MTKDLGIDPSAMAPILRESDYSSGFLDGIAREWSAVFDAPPAKSHAEILVTQEMIADGILERVRWNESIERWLPKVYRAMAAVAPSESITIVTEDVLGQRNAAWDRIAALTAERDNALAVAAHHLESIQDRDARITELKSELARRPAAFVDREPKPLKHNPFREHRRDQRWMGR